MISSNGNITVLQSAWANKRQWMESNVLIADDHSLIITETNVNPHMQHSMYGDLNPEASRDVNT